MFLRRDLRQWADYYANPALSIGAALGITFPFNLFVGIPLYYRAAQYVYHE